MQPGMELAEQNLADSKLPIGERHGPWPFPMPHWISRRTIQELAAEVNAPASRSSADRGDAATRRLLSEHPEIARLVPALLDRGDEAARDFAVRVAQLLATPELHEALRVYCLSARGPDGLRMEVANYLYQKGVLESNRLRLWSGGEQRELELIGFDISWEPTPSDRSPQVQQWLGDGIEAAQAGDGKQAERLFKKCLEATAEAPDLLNNLAGAYEMQGWHDEGYRLLREIHERWPDYFFGRISMANLAVADHDFERAEEMLAPLRRQRKLHITEFDALAICSIRLFIAQDKLDSARSWLDMFRQVDPDHPSIPAFDAMLNGSLDPPQWRARRR